MKTIQLGASSLQVPVVASGCMRMRDLDVKAAEGFINAALDMGVNFFDHADIYGGGLSEEIFAKAIMSPSNRERMILQSKCGIRGGWYDFSKEHILEAVEGSLKRLQTDHLDVLLLHRPDALVEPEEVAAAFDQLQSNGKVLNFGISNHNPMQIELLKTCVMQPLVANQLQLSAAHLPMISSGVNVNTATEFAVNRDGSVLDYCRVGKITIQPWSPFQYGNIEGVFLGDDRFPELNKAIDKLAEKYGVSNTTIAIAWILRHPAKMQPIVGTMSAQRLEECVKAADVCITKEEWYDVYKAGGNLVP